MYMWKPNLLYLYHNVQQLHVHTLYSCTFCTSTFEHFVQFHPLYNSILYVHFLCILATCVIHFLCDPHLVHLLLTLAIAFAITYSHIQNYLTAILYISAHLSMVTGTKSWDISPAHSWSHQFMCSLSESLQLFLLCMLNHRTLLLRV